MGVQKRTPECVDCLAEGVTTWRPITTGTRKPRCATHSRAAKKRSQLVAHASRVQSGFGISGEAYWALYEAQGGRCALCRIATGKTKRLAVDHDHKAPCIERGDHPADKGCPQCIRGLACGRCNQDLVVHPVETLIRTIDYKLNPPARAVLARFQNLDCDPPASTESDFPAESDLR